MNNKLKQSLAVYICAFICWLVPGIIWASVEVDGIYYDLNTTAKTAAVASNPNYYTGAIDIPSSFVYNGSTYNVKSIGSRAFLNCSELISIIFPSSVTTIGSSAFERCTGLTDVVIGSGVTLIDYEAFKNCSNLRSLTLPSSLKTIENETFSGCTSLSEIIAKRTTPPTIVSTTFDGVDKTACIVYVPEGCQPMYAKATNWKAFSNIDELTVVATGSCGIDGDNVTYTIYSDMTMVISGTGEMRDYAYNIHINDDYYQSIKKVIIDDGVTGIGDFALNRCTGLTSATIGNSVTSIGYYTFSGCTSLTSVTIPNSVTSIGTLSFNNCIGLTSVTIGNSVTEIGISAFIGCTGLISITIPNSVVSIGYSAFSGCTSLTSINIPNSVNCIDEEAFSGCIGLSSITVASDNNTYDSRNNCNAIIETSSNILIVGCKNTVIPFGVIAIGSSAFSNCISLTSITIPNSVTSIGSCAFSDCSNLTSVAIGNSVTTIDEYAFYGCTSLASVTIPNSVTTISYGAFESCTNLLSVTIGNSVTYVGANAFYETAWYDNQPEGLIYINKIAYKYKGEMPKGTNITIKSGTVSISNSAFAGCDFLATVTIPNSITDIGAGAFSWCTGLSSVVIPNSVTYIDWRTFEGCGSLTSLMIGNGVTHIGECAFWGCSCLKSIYINRETPPYVEDGVFWEVERDEAIVYVPIGSKEVYQGWHEFENIIEYEFDTDISALGNAIYVEQTEGRIGGTMDIPVKLKNSYPVRGFQFTLELPEGATINSWALSTNRLPSGATLSDKIATQKIEGNKITVACSLNYGDATFTGNDGEIATVNVSFGEDMEVGSYPIYLAACDVTTASGVDEDLSDVKATLVLEDYVVGDANGDGKVRIGDATTILNYIVGAPSDNFKAKAADANGDGKIRIGDATTILNIIVNQ